MDHAAPLHAIILALASAGIAFVAGAPTQPPAHPNPGALAMSQHAKGPFDVKVPPLPPDAGIGHASISRLNLFKQLHGDLQGQVHGQMLAQGNPNGGAAGYVAMDFVEARLAGREGTFAMQHIGSMGAGPMRMDINIVPGSGTGDFAGIEGRFNITIVDKQHHYDLEYTLPAP